MEQTIRVITCPCCKSVLYALEADSADSAAPWKMTKDSPAVQNDGEGHFMKCVTCSNRVAVEKASGPGAGGWSIASTQKCSPARR